MNCPKCNSTNTWHELISGKTGCYNCGWKKRVSKERKAEGKKILNTLNGIIGDEK